MLKINFSKIHKASRGLSKVWIWIFVFASSISAFIVPLYRFQSVFYTRDWTLFNSMSYFVRSSWLHYHTFPLHNPYVFGGMDMLANPQSNILSPFTLFDVLFPAPYANLLSVVVLSAIGGYGVFKLLRGLKVGLLTTFLLVFIFIHGSWFSMHFTEGHIIFGSFQLIGWVLYFTLRINQPKYMVYLAALLAFMVIDGGMYAFIYSSLLIVFSLLFRVNKVSFLDLLKTIKKNGLVALFALFIFLGISSTKIVPLIALHGNRVAVLENLFLEFKTVLYAFFYPFQDNFLRIDEASIHDYSLGFMEIGAYIGIVTFAITFFHVVFRFRKKYLPYLLMVGLFFWIGSGWGKDINPWSVFQKIPILHNAHVQTRALFLVWFFILILFSFSFDDLRDRSNKILILILAGFLILESSYVATYSYRSNFKDKDSYNSSELFSTLLQNTTIEKTIASPGDWGLHYQLYEKRNTASKGFMDPAVNRGDIKTITDKGYRGEIYFISGQGHAEIKGYTPKNLRIQLQTSSPALVQVNTNYLLGWISDSEAIEVSSVNGLMTIKTQGIDDEIQLYYRPFYFYYVLTLYLLSLISLILFIYANTRKSLNKI